ncbi:MAG: ATP-binding protein [Acidimicrobiales bacterium]
MFDNLNLRNKFLAAVVVPLGFLAALALWSVAASHHLLGALALMAGAATVGIAYRIAEEVDTRAAAVAAQATELASVRLPAVLGSLTQPLGDGADSRAETGVGVEDGETPAPVTGRDELGRMGEALTLVETRAREAVDQERATISRNLGAMVKNLARRNQSLLDRQIEHIDWLEAKEQDPDRLEQLFKLDHLATRMRRTSESVLVLGGAEATRQRGGPAPIADVLRVAMGETEDYRNIRLRTVDEVKLAGGPAFDLAHLLAELLENATQFSPPESPVEIHAVNLGTEGYQVTVIDRGVGMDERQLDEANDVLADPPDISLSIGHSVGFIVIGRLARRLGASVELSPTAGSGVTAQVILPASVLIDAPAVAGGASGAASDRPATTGTGGPLDRLLSVDSAALPQGEGWQAPKVDQRKGKPLRARDGATAAVPDSLKPAAARAPETEPAPQPEAAPEPEADPVAEPVTRAERPLPSRADRPALPPSKRPRPDRSSGDKAARTLAEAIPTGAAFDTGVEGLLADGTPADGGTGPAAVDPDAPWVPPTAAGDPGGSLTRRQKGASAAPQPKGPGARASNRKPDEIRSMITRYRDGLKGTGAGPTPTTSIVPDAPPIDAAEIDPDVIDAAEAVLRSVDEGPAETGASEPTTASAAEAGAAGSGSGSGSGARTRRRNRSGSGNGKTPAGEEK